MRKVNLTQREMISCACGGDLILINPRSEENVFVKCERCERSEYISEIAAEENVGIDYFINMLNEDREETT